MLRISDIDTFTLGIQEAYDYKRGLDTLYDLIKADLVEKVGE